MDFHALTNGKTSYVAGVIFLVSFAARLLLDLLFHLRFGLHAANYPEVWLYTGVMQGTKLPGNGIFDPSTWFLGALGVVFQGGLAFYGTILAAAALSASTAALVFLLASEAYDRKAAVAAGLIYGGMAEPLTLSMSGFTHDLIQLPLMIASILLAVKTLKAKAWDKLVFVAAYVVIVYAGLHVNDVMYVAVGLAFVYAGYGVLSKYAGEDVYIPYMAVFVFGIGIAGFFAMPAVVERMIAGLPQGVGGSDDTSPTNLTVLFIRYNILLLIVPFGLTQALKRKDVLGIGFTMTGLMLAAYVDRGTRISDVGLALVAATALSDWNVKGRGFFARKDRFRWTLIWSVPVAVWALLVLPLVYVFFFAAFALALLYGLKNFGGERMFLAVLSILLLAGVAVNTAYILTAEGRNIVSDAEYRILDWLAGNNKGGRILTTWDHGYMAETITGLESASTPNKIDTVVHDALWMQEDDARSMLRENGVRYVLVNSDNFKVVQDQKGRRGYRFLGGLVFPPKKLPPVENAGNYTVYRMSHMTTGEAFTLVRREKDEATGVEFLLYEVR